MIRLENVGMAYAEGGRQVLFGLNLHVAPGEFLCLLGQSGCGKTTLLHLVAGFLRPTEGRVLVGGQVVTGPGPDRAMIFQEATLFPWLTVAGNVAFGLRQQGLSRSERERIVADELRRTGLSDHARTYPCRLSGGMRQRVALARVLALNPPVLLLDEPFSALDIPTRERLQDDLQDLWAAHRSTVVYVTHSAEEAACLAQRIVVLAPDGRIIHEERPGLPTPRDRSAPATLEIEARLRNVLRGCARRETL